MKPMHQCAGGYGMFGPGWFRDTETEEQIQKRLKNAKKELERAKDPTLFDYILVNAELDQAYEELKVDNAWPFLLQFLYSCVWFVGWFYQEYRQDDLVELFFPMLLCSIFQIQSTFFVFFLCVAGLARSRQFDYIYPLPWHYGISYDAFLYISLCWDLLDLLGLADYSNYVFFSSFFCLKFRLVWQLATSGIETNWWPRLCSAKWI